VLLSSLLPGERLAPHHIAAPRSASPHVLRLFAGGGEQRFEAAALIPVIAAAFIAAFRWAGYSVMSRRLAAVPTDAVAGFCLATQAPASQCCVTRAGSDRLAADHVQWLAVIALASARWGSPSFAWDIGMKRGDIACSGRRPTPRRCSPPPSSSSPGFAQATTTLALAALLIAGGGLPRGEGDDGGARRG